MTDSDVMEPVVLDFERICRACKSEEGVMHDVYTNTLGTDPSCPRIDEMLMACTSLQITRDDGLPNLICEQCVNSLKLCYDFKVLCERSDQELRQAAENLRNSEEADLQAKISEIEDMIDFNLVRNRASDKPQHEILVPPDAPEEKCDFIEILENNQMILTCKQCYKVFTTLDGLKCHKRLHTGCLYRCKQCDKAYSRLGHLQRHELTHERRKVHICRICNKTLTRFEHLKRHLVIHLKEKPFSCEKCTRGFNRAEHLANHAEKCKGEPLHICNICNKGFGRADTLEVHKNLHDNKDPVLLTLDNLDNIEEHYIEIDHDMNDNGIGDSDDDDDDDEDVDLLEPLVNIMINDSKPRGEEVMEEIVELKFEDEVEEPNPLSSEEPSQVAECCENNDSDSDHSEYTPTKILSKVKRGRGRPRKNPVKLKGRRGRPPKQPKFEMKEEETEDEVSLTCPICNEEFSRVSVLEKHAAQHAGAKIFVCSTCKKTFSRPSHLKRHEASHLEQRKYTCKLCPKTFRRSDHLTQHVKLHSRGQEFSCDICKRPFTRADHLAQHKQNKHGSNERVRSEKKYKCNECQKCFTTEKYRDVHMKLHTGDKRFQCKTCDKICVSKSHLTEHMKFHSDSSKKFLCSECGQRFIRNDYLVIHMRRHRGEKPFKCKFCGKGFPRTTDLTVHERYHTGEKTHLCVICGRGFGRAYNLTVHMRTHTGEKPYQCTYCDAAFAQGNDLKAHVRRHTGERFQCDLCLETFIMGYLLTQHKRLVHGLNVVSNIRRLQPAIKENPDEPPPITITLPAPVVPSTILNAQLHAQIQLARIQNDIVHE